MSTCLKCWTDVGDARFCPECGTAQHAAPDAKPEGNGAFDHHLAAVGPDDPRVWWKNGRYQVPIVVAVAALFFGGRFVAQQQGWIAKGSLDGASISSSLETSLKDRADITATVTCPYSVPNRKGSIVDCNVSVGSKSSQLFVTLEDLSGHYRYEVEDPSVLIP